MEFTTRIKFSIEDVSISNTFVMFWAATILISNFGNLCKNYVFSRGKLSESMIYPKGMTMDS